MSKILVCISILVLLTFSACGSSASYSSAPPSASAAADTSPSESYSEATYMDSDRSSTPLPLMTPTNPGGKKIVYTVSMKLQTLAFSEGTRYLLETTDSLDGFVQSTYVEGRSLRSPDSERFARYTLRIPSENLALFLNEMEDNYNLLLLQQDSENVSGSHTSSNSRIEALEQQEQLLLSDIAQTEDVDDRLELERQLLEVQTEIGVLRASVTDLEDAVIYSTVTIELYEVILPDEDIGEWAPPSFGERLGDTASNSWSGFVGGLQGIVLFTVAILPLALSLGVIALVVLLVYRKVKHLSRSALLPKEQTAQDDDLKE